MAAPMAAARRFAERSPLGQSKKATSRRPGMLARLRQVPAGITSAINVTNFLLERRSVALKPRAPHIVSRPARRPAPVEPGPRHPGPKQDGPKPRPMPRPKQ